MRRSVIVIFCIAILLSCTKKDPPHSAGNPLEMHTEVLLRTTPVKNQGNSDLCWIYAMLATIETEHIMSGDSLDLSAAYLTRHLLADEASRLYAQGDAPITTRGMMTMTLSLLTLHGAMPYTSYRMPENVDLKSLPLQIQRIAKSHHAHPKGITSLENSINQVLDDALGPVPTWVFMLGSEYTPLEFAHSLFSKGEYTALTSFTHHPFGHRFVLEVPDNRYHDSFLNVPLDSMMNYIDHSLRTGHPVCWEGDISEPGFLFKEGKATLDKKQGKVTQEDRQQGFDYKQTTDDHCMEMIGIAHDNQGKKYYICKNSWGKDNPFNGLMFMDENYARAKTIAVVLPSVTLPEMDRIAGEKKNEDMNITIPLP